MRLAGRVFKVGRYWAVEVPILAVVTQGRTRKEAYEMIADAVEALANREGFRVDVHAGQDGYFEIGSDQPGVLTALLLRRERLRSGLSLAEVAAKLGAVSVNTYARYEQGRAVPSIQKLSQLLSAVAPHGDFVLVESSVA